jgi:hypothetical protein
MASEESLFVEEIVPSKGEVETISSRNARFLNTTSSPRLFLR